jgi:hypothetical protein
MEKTIDKIYYDLTPPLVDLDLSVLPFAETESRI